jgi:hypothetical protein
MEFGFGSGILTGLRNDSAAGAAPTPRRFGALQDVNIEFTGDIKELFATQQFPIDTARGKTKITGKAKVAEIKAAEYNDIFFGQTLATGSLKYAYNESVASGTSAVTYTVANAGSTPLTDEGAFYVANGNQLTAVTGGASAGQYVWNASTGVYTFATADAGNGFFVNYIYNVTTGYSIAIGNPFMGTTPQFKATLFQQFEGNQIVLVLNKCVSSRLTFPTRIDDYLIQELDFSAFADAAGNVGSWNSTN